MSRYTFSSLNLNNSRIEVEGFNILKALENLGELKVDDIDKETLILKNGEILIDEDGYTINLEDIYPFDLEKY